jgi:tRNA(fMet)-specific endonuclease VapC
MATRMLDTDVLSYIHSSNPNRATPYKQHLTGHVLAVSFITIGEQFAGYHKKIKRGEWNQQHLDKLELRLRSLLVIPYDIEICRTYGHLKAHIKNRDGSDRVVGVNDLWIASCAVRHSLTLVTNNGKHFENIPGLSIICGASRERMAEGGGTEPQAASADRPDINRPQAPDKDQPPKR